MGYKYFTSNHRKETHMKVINSKTYYSLQDLQKKLGVSYMTVWRWKEDGKLPMVKILNRFYIEEKVFTNIEQYI